MGQFDQIIAKATGVVALFGLVVHCLLDKLRFRKLEKKK